MSASSPTPLRMDLNADLGEGVTDDTGLLAVVTSANVACGFHAGDAEVMRAVCEGAATRGVAVGAQVSYLDREGFGRRPMDPAPAVLRDWVAEQVAALRDAARGTGAAVSYLKPHGALYHRVADDDRQADAVLDGGDGLPVLGLPGSRLLDLAAARGLVVVPEGFPDRGYTPDGRLVPRGEPGALVAGVEQVAANAVALARSGRVRTVCVHGDSPDAVAAAAAIRTALADAGFDVRAWGFS